MPFIELANQYKMHYELLGDVSNPPVVTIHGWLGTPQRDLEPVNSWLGEHFSVYSPTLCGYGQSRPPQRDFPVGFYERDADDIVAFMDALDIERAHLVGYSDGGESALIAAGKHTRRFLNVFVWGAVGYFGEQMVPMAQRILKDPFLKENPELMALHGIDDPDAFIADWVDAVLYIISEGGEVSVQYAAEIANPLLLLLGDRDTLNPAKYAQRVAEQAQKGKFELVEDSGHKIHIDQPEIFQRHLSAFLDI